MNRITTAKSSVVHKVQTPDQPATPRADVLQGKLVLDTQGHALHGPIVHSMFVPMHYERNYAYPLVVWLHGDADDERQLHRIMPFLSLRNFVAAAPRGQRPRTSHSLDASSRDSESLDSVSRDLVSRDETQSPTETQGQTRAQGQTEAQGQAGKQGHIGTLGESSGPAAHDKNVSQPESSLGHSSAGESAPPSTRGLLAAATQRGFSWELSDSGVEQAVESIASTIDYASTRAHINPRKVVLVGFESGATMALQVGLQHPERYAGIVAIGGGLPETGRPLASLSQARQLPLLLCQGRYSEGYNDEKLCHDLRLLHIGGFSVTLRQYPCGDDLVDLMLKDANSWIMERVTGGLIS